MTGFNWDSVVDALNTHGVPEICLMFMGLVALAVVISYVKDKESFLYKVLVLIGLLVGIFMVFVALTIDTGWGSATMIVITIACFTLIIRPFREVNFALVLALLVMACVYVYLGDLTGNLEFLSETWPRVIAALVIGAVIYMIAGFIQDIIQLFGKILNAWPFLLINGLWCILEAAFILSSNGTVLDYVSSLMSSSESLIPVL